MENTGTHFVVAYLSVQEAEMQEGQALIERAAMLQAAMLAQNAAVFLASALYFRVLLSRVAAERVNLFAVFFRVPRRVVMRLATARVCVTLDSDEEEEESDDSDDEWTQRVLVRQKNGNRRDSEASVMTGADGAAGASLGPEGVDQDANTVQSLPLVPLGPYIGQIHGATLDSVADMSTLQQQGPEPDRSTSIVIWAASQNYGGGAGSSLHQSSSVARPPSRVRSSELPQMGGTGWPAGHFAGQMRPLPEAASLRPAMVESSEDGLLVARPSVRGPSVRGPSVRGPSVRGMLVRGTSTHTKPRAMRSRRGSNNSVERSNTSRHSAKRFVHLRVPTLATARKRLKSRGSAAYAFLVPLILWGAATVSGALCVFPPAFRPPAGRSYVDARPT